MAEGASAAASTRARPFVQTARAARSDGRVLFRIENHEIDEKRPHGSCGKWPKALPQPLQLVRVLSFKPQELRDLMVVCFFVSRIMRSTRSAHMVVAENGRRRFRSRFNSCASFRSNRKSCAIKSESDAVNPPVSAGVDGSGFALMSLHAIAFAISARSRW